MEIAWLMILALISGGAYVWGRSMGRREERTWQEKKQAVAKLAGTGDDSTVKTYPISEQKSELSLGEEQQAIFEQIEASLDHFFITGKAGTGKSHLLRYLKQNTHKSCVVVAPTGVAALNVGGQTIHSLFKLPPSLINHGAVTVGYKTKELLSHVDMIIIDEVSMVRADLMDGIDSVMRQAKRSDLAFGGTQVVMFGDLFQLPPVVSDRELHRYFAQTTGGAYFFQARVWQKVSFSLLELHYNYRQQDAELIELLNAVRLGDVDDQVLERLNVRVSRDDSAGVLTLATTNNRVMQINMARLRQISSQSYIYQADVQGDLSRRDFPAEERLELKVGAQVMMLKNDREKRWVNGTVGSVAGLKNNSIKVKIDGSVYPVEREVWNKIRYFYNKEQKRIEEEVIGQFTQYPLKLAWAITIHKSQGHTYDAVRIDLERGAFAHGQTYVALSRCRTLKGITLARGIERRDVIVDPVVREFLG